MSFQILLDWLRYLNTRYASKPPIICAIINGIVSPYWIPEKVLVNVLAIVTAGLAKLVEEVNQ